MCQPPASLHRIRRTGKRESPRNWRGCGTGRMHPGSCLSSGHRCLPPLWFHSGEVKETKLSSGSLASLSFPCRRWNKDCLCEGHRGIFSMGEERQNIKYMGKYASCSCKRTCSRLLFLLERIYLPATQQGEESTSFFHHLFLSPLGKAGEGGGCVLLFPPHTNLAGPIIGFVPDAGTPHCWQLLALCADSGSAGGLEMEQSCGAVALLGPGP